MCSINVPNEIIHGIKKQTLNLKEVDKDANFGGKGGWLTSKRKICLNVDSPQQYGTLSLFQHFLACVLLDDWNPVFLDRFNHFN